MTEEQQPKVKRVGRYDQVREPTGVEIDPTTGCQINIRLIDKKNRKTMPRNPQASGVDFDPF